VGIDAILTPNSFGGFAVKNLMPTVAETMATSRHGLIGQLEMAINCSPSRAKSSTLAPMRIRNLFFDWNDDGLLRAGVRGPANAARRPRENLA
jgi:hypothetical protein